MLPLVQPDQNCFFLDPAFIDYVILLHSPLSVLNNMFLFVYVLSLFYISTMPSVIYRAFFNIKTGGGGKCPPSSQLCLPSEEAFDPRKYPFLYRFSAMLSKNYCCHRVAMNGALRVSSAKE